MVGTITKVAMSAPDGAGRHGHGSCAEAGLLKKLTIVSA
jgi:hypothetical protein